MAALAGAHTSAPPPPPPPPPPPQRVWIPIDVKLGWLAFLGARDLAVASAASRSWGGLVARAVDAELVRATGALPPALCAAAKLRLLHRVRHPLDKRNCGYLLAWAAGSRGACARRVHAGSGRRAAHAHVRNCRVC